ncbi:hypothetical protein Pfo_028879 [Paulownia fortunei]|nr:hypothetical protein Pfo_028879 [Paulownia fortunei]
MSGSNSPQFFPVGKEEDKEGVINLGNSSQPMSENLGSCPEIVSETETPAEEKEKGNLDSADRQKELEEIKNEEETDKATVSSRESEKQIAEDEDGFKTPTSSDHRIPAIMQCPPAPKKTRPQSSKLKRKASPPGAGRTLQLDASTEVESIFLPIPNPDNAEEQKIKKARRDDKD